MPRARPGRIPFAGRRDASPARLKSAAASRTRSEVTASRPLRVALPLALLIGGCSTLAHKHVAPHAAPPSAEAAPALPTAEAEADPRRVLVLVVEGLRQGVLTGYLDRLDEADHEPDWPSGLALLRQEGFRFATAGQAEAPVPGGGLAAAATWATGQWPDTHRIVGEAFYEARGDGRMLRYAFDTPLDGSRVHYAPALGWPDFARPTLAGALLAGPTWPARLMPGREVGVVFAPFGQGGHWLVPEPADVGAAALLSTEYAAAATPLFDREVGDGALELLLRDDVPVVVAWFRGVAVDTCIQPAADCGGAEGGINAIQRRALQALDGRLAEVLGRYLIARPGDFARTSVLLVGTGSGIDRGAQAPALHKVMPPETLLDRVVERADEACVARLSEARRRGDLLVAAGADSVARIYVRPAPPGQSHRVRAELACLGPAVDALLASSPWVAAVARMPAERLDEPGPRAARFRIALRSEFEKGLSARRRSRLIARIRRSIDDGPAPRSGDVVVFAASGWIFADPDREGLLPDAALGGLTDVSMAIPFLVADPALSDVAEGAMRSTTVELADVAPTVLALAGAPDAALAELPRPPVVRWREAPRRVLEYVRADRRIAAPSAGPLPAVTFAEDEATVTIGLEESTELWPADVIALRIGETTWRWDPDANAFPAELPCTYAEADGRRRWRCTAPVDRRGPALSLAAVKRAPSGDDAVDGPLVRVLPLVLGESKPYLGEGRALCVRPGGLRVKLVAEDPLGLARAEVFVVDDRIGGEGHIPGGLAAEVALGGVEPTPTCAADPFAADCAVAASATRVEGAVDVPFDPLLLEHHAAARRLPGVEAVDRAQLLARWSAAGDPGTAPQRAWLALRLCNVAGQCVRRPLISDVDLRALGPCP